MYMVLWRSEISDLGLKAPHLFNIIRASVGDVGVCTARQALNHL